MSKGKRGEIDDALDEMEGCMNKALREYETTQGISDQQYMAIIVSLVKVIRQMHRTITFLAFNMPMQGTRKEQNITRAHIVDQLGTKSYEEFKKQKTANRSRS